ncbi:MAG: Calx-beta domain-containing protein [Chloroflexota bacterium]
MAITRRGVGMIVVLCHRLLPLCAALLLALAGLFLFAAPALAATYVVNSTADTADPNLGDGFCDVDLVTDGDQCTLRAAIQNVNQDGGGAINFDFSGLGSPAPYVIHVTGSDLLFVTASVTIDGLSEPMVTDNLCPLPAFPDPPGALSVQIDGGDARTNGLFLAGTGSVVRGLSVTNFTNVGIWLAGNDVSAFCNYVGVDADGSDNGTNGNAVAGIRLGGGNNARVGGLNFGEGNLIAHNGDGVEIPAVQGTIQGNILRDNVNNGVFVNPSIIDIVGNTIEQNVITGNGHDGVQVLRAGGAGSFGNLISQNSIFGNGTAANDLGIDLLDPDGVNPNDPGDTDSGNPTNNGQNYPVLTSASTGGGSTTVVGTLDSVSGITYTIEFFSNPACDASGHGEGKTYIGSTSVTINGGNPTGAFTATGLANTAQGAIVTATAINTSTNDTSEFSACRTVAEAPQAGPTLTVTTADDHDDGVCGPADCSLREAILLANALAGPNTIQFNIPGGGVKLITLGSALPDITGSVTIDGLTQNGGFACPVPSGSLLIRLDGSGTVANGLSLIAGSNGSTVRGLSVTRFASAGISIVSSSSHSIECNYLGLAANGSTAGGNTGQGVFLASTSSTVTVGGASTSNANVIAYNGAAGVAVQGSSHVVRGNRIRNNVNVGVLVSQSTNVVQGNDIRDNGGDGVLIGSPGTPTGVQVTQNTVHGNGGLGIDLVGADGVNADDPGDADTGPNNLQNFPVLARASSNGTNTTVVGTLDSVSGVTYTVEFFSNPACDASGNGEGEVYLGSTSVTINGANPTGAFTATLPNVALGQVVTATATRNSAPLDTSEFSACRTVTGPPGVTVAESGGSTAVAEGGATDTFTVVLTSQPTADVTIAIAPGTQVTTTPAGPLTFTTANWSTPQTVTVAAVDDTVAEGPHNATITMTATSADAAYNGISIANVSVAITDNDTPGFTVSPTSGLVTTEAGGTATFTVRLNTVPTAPVTITLTSSDTTEGTVSPTTLTFQPNATALNPQTVTVTGQNDALADGNVAYTIVLAPATSADPAYNNVDPPDVSVVNTDDEAALSVSINDANVTEGDAGTSTLTFTVTLSAPPPAPVTVPYTVANGTATGGPVCSPGIDFVNTPGSVTFQTTETQKTIAVTVCADTLTEGPETVLVNLGTPTNGVVGDGQGVGTILDDDVAGTLSFTATGAQVLENAGSITLTVQRTGVGGGPTSPAAPPASAPTNVPSGSVVPNSSPIPANLPSGSIRPNTPPAPLPGGRQPGPGPSAVSTVAVNFATANGTAIAGQDYVATAGTLTFGPTETVKTIVIPILNDNALEANETFTVTLSSPSGGVALGTTTVFTVTIVDTTSPPSPTIKPPDDDTDKPRKLTDEERQQRQHTNAGNKDDVYTEGDVVEVHLDEQPPYIVIGTRDGLERVNLPCGRDCPAIQVGDYVEADGQKQNEALFDATDITVWRDGKKVK